MTHTVHPLIQYNHIRRSLTAAPTLNRRGATSHKKEFQGTLRSRQGCHHRLVWGEAFNVGSTCATAITQATGHRLNCHRGPAPSSLPPTIFFMPVLLFTLFRRYKNLPSIWKKKYSDHSFSFVFLYAHSYCHHQIHGRQSQRTTRRT